MQGTHIVAACVRYRNGKPQPTKYRRFNIRSTQTQDDYASMQEAVKRRYAQGDLPDLIVIDGGRGQLSAAQQALTNLEKNHPVVALAKQEEEVYAPGLKHPLPIPRNDPGLLLLMRVRDAAHRFVLAHHRQKRSKAMTSSYLDHVQGIGPKRKEALYKRFKTFTNIQQASKEELQAVLGETTGEHLYTQLRQET